MQKGSGKWDECTRIHPKHCCIRAIREVKSKESRILWPCSVCTVLWCLSTTHCCGPKQSELPTSMPAHHLYTKGCSIPSMQCSHSWLATAFWVSLQVVPLLEGAVPGRCGATPASSAAGRLMGCTTNLLCSQPPPVDTAGSFGHRTVGNCFRPLGRPKLSCAQITTSTRCSDGWKAASQANSGTKTTIGC